MPRVKRGVTQRRRHKRLLKEAKGYKWRRKNVYRLAKEAVWHAGQKAFGDRRKKKGDFRRLWQIRINAATRERDLTYSKFINGLKKANIEIDRKILSELAIEEPKVFDALVEEAKKNLSTKTTAAKSPSTPKKTKTKQIEKSI